MNRNVLSRVREIAIGWCRRNLRRQAVPHLRASNRKCSAANSEAVNRRLDEAVVAERAKSPSTSGAGTNLKVGAPLRRKKIFVRAPPLFGSKITVSRFGERFRDDQYSLVSFLFVVLLLTVLPYPAICKSGGTCLPPCPTESAPLPATWKATKRMKRRVQTIGDK